MRKNIAIWPSLSGKVRLAAESSDGTSVWRNGGTQGNSPEALRPDHEYDTPILSSILSYFRECYGAQPLSVSHHVLILKVKPWQLFSALWDLAYLLRHSGGRTYISIPSRRPKMVV